MVLLEGTVEAAEVVVDTAPELEAERADTVLVTVGLQPLLSRPLIRLKRLKMPNMRLQLRLPSKQKLH